jgi:ABC-type lipoprotein export system ATPase subunit
MFELSVAIARALMNKPRIVLADEPSGNLDTDSGTALFKLLREINNELKTTFLIVTHDRFLAAACDRVISINDGMIGEDLKITPNSRDDLDELSSCYCRLRNHDANPNR